MTLRLPQLLLLALASLPGQTLAVEGIDMWNMMRMMGSMMDMWDSVNSRDPWGQGPGYGPRPPGYGWGGGGNDYGWETLQAPQTNPWAHNANIDGLWQTADGYRMLLDGDSFSLETADGGRAQGAYLIYRNRFVAYVANSDSTLQFAFEYRGDRFALQDQSGRLLLFQRMPDYEVVPPPANW